MDFEEFMLEISINNLNRESQRLKDLDNKAIGLITITGILITFLSNFAKLEYCSTKILFSNILLFLFTTLIFSLLAIRIRLVNLLSTNCLIKDFGSEINSNEQKKDLIQIIGEAEEELDKVCSAKATEIKYAIYSLGISIIFIIFYTISIVIL